MSDNQFDEIGSKAVVRMIDTVRDYLRSNATLCSGLLVEEAITQEEYDEGMAENEPLRQWLKKQEQKQELRQWLEKHDAEEYLTIKVKH
jgi:hypothetical protein